MPLKFKFIWVAIFTFFLGVCYAQEIPDFDSSFLVDTTSWLSSQEAVSLKNKLKTINSKDHVRIAVLIVHSTSGEDIESFSIKVAEKWKVGNKNSDNGVIIVIAKKDKKMRIEVGYGIEGSIPDVTAHRIIESMKPYMKNNQIFSALDFAIGSIEKKVEKKDSPTKEKDNSYLLWISIGLGIINGLFLYLFEDYLFKIFWIPSLYGGFLAYNNSTSGEIFLYIFLCIVISFIVRIITSIDFDSGSSDSFISSSSSSSSNDGGGGSFGGGGSSGSWD